MIMLTDIEVIKLIKLYIHLDDLMLYTNIETISKDDIRILGYINLEYCQDFITMHNINLIEKIQEVCKCYTAKEIYKIIIGKI